jgi:hypothetical protein
MINYFYNKETLEFTQEKEAELDPRETELKGENVYLRLPNCTRKEPLQPKEGKAVVFDIETNKWKYVIDQRGTKYLLPGDRREYTIQELDQEVPENSLDSLDPELVKEDLWSYTKGVRSNKITSHLQHSGKEYRALPSSIKSMEEVVAELHDPDEITWKDASKEKVVLTCADIKSMLTQFRLRKQLMYKASWLVEDVIKNSADPKNLDIDALFNEKITEASA